MGVGVIVKLRQELINKCVAKGCDHNCRKNKADNSDRFRCFHSFLQLKLRAHTALGYVYLLIFHGSGQVGEDLAKTEGDNLCRLINNTRIDTRDA